ncbi:MAG: phosphatidylserine/phosphatidylglycerophosphate/cardiolipin synthase family protein [Deltaproteobacteria bacterium]|nr:phosphatidylserine/phosphatidylglycerophosphate/cardiolipin synthase family protein [Deltaproteobacteria bacterium]MBW2395837.1 phosphatidylserine/phosphatidylglycerophosphate/cardiolipin synthase family protein [Deltaproteobacteria bacterium]
MKGDAKHIPHVETGAYPLRPGNQVEPLVDGEKAFRAIVRAVADARESVWVTVAFLKAGFEMPDGHGSLFDVLDQAVERGLDVRVIFWRSQPQEDDMPGVHFLGTEAQRQELAARGSRFKARWDVLPGELCHHQKSWLVDAGTADEIAFVGGINLDPASVAAPGHTPRDEGNIHDVYVCVRGPSATDVHHNFVQRWNEASERDREDGAWPDAAACDDLHFPEDLSPSCGEVPVQITRTVRHEIYKSEHPTPGGKPFAVAGGERSVLDQYMAAIDAAERSIYIEDQVIASPPIIAGLDAALERGVEVVFLVPGHVHPQFAEARKNPKLAALFEPLHALGRFENFCLAGIASNAGPAKYHDVYVHAKIALVDDVWGTIGSTNVADRSFRGDTEMNASFWHRPTVQALRIELLLEHLAADTSHLDDAAAMCLYREKAGENAAARSQGKPLDGLAFEIDPVRYGC